MVEKKHATIGASEFAATLNGDDPHEILRVLKLFAKTVQKERQLALFGEQEDSDSDSSDDDNDDEEERPTKKLKKDEQWKEDSASYNVPFVGTAVSRSDVSEVVRGQWPTGLLGAYLDKSPLAIELMNEDISSVEGKIHRSLMRKKQVKTSRAIQKAYYNSVAQLLTAVIPIQKLREQNGGEKDDSTTGDDGDATIIQGEYGKFLPTLLKKRLPEVFDVLNGETAKSLGGCGNLAVPALRLIQNVVLTSTFNARLISKYLDENFHHGVLRSLLRPPPPTKTVPTNDKNESPNDLISRRIEARAEAMELANVLLKTQDTAVNTYICTSGSKERKVKPGILFVAMREGLSLSKAEAQSPSNENVDDDDEADYWDAVADLLESFRVLVFNQHKSMNSRMLSELLSGEPIQHLCHLLTHAPALGGKNTFQSVLACEDSYGDDLGSLPSVGVEARRIVFPLLHDSSRSPFLSATQQGKTDTHQLGKIMLSLLRTPSGAKGVHKFLIACAHDVPLLVPTLFRVLSFPDPRRTYDFVTTTHFVSSMLRSGPSVADCLTGEEGANVQELMFAIFPAKFKKQAFAKAMQSKNSLVVMGCLMLLHTVLKRLEKLRAESMNDLKWSGDYVQEIIDATLNACPDIQVLLQIRTHFDAFTGSKEGAVVNERLFQVVMLLVKVSPSYVRGANFDWMKLVPSDAQRFFKALPMVQRSLLRSLALVIEVWECPSHLIFQAFKNVVEIMLNTRQKSIYNESKTISIGLLVKMLNSRWTDANSESFIRYESECWINGLTVGSLPAFYSLLRDVTENELQIVAKIGNIWSKCKAVGPMMCSLLLFASWTIPEPVPAFAKLVAQVSSRAMLFHRSPMVVANLIHFANQESCWSKTKSVSAYTERLVEYSNLLCKYENGIGEEYKMLGEVLTSVFGKKDMFLTTFNWVHENSSVPVKSLLDDLPQDSLREEALALARFLIHLYVIAEEGGRVATRCWTVLLIVACKVLIGSDSDETKDGIINDISLCNSHETRLPLLVASCPADACSEFARSRFNILSEVLASTRTNNSIKDCRVRLLKVLLVWDSIPMNIVAKSQLEVIKISVGKSGSSSATSVDFSLNFLQRTNAVWRAASCETDVIQSLFSQWWTMSSKRKSGESLNEVENELCSALTAILENRDSLSAMVVALIQQCRPLDDFVTRCLSSEFSSGISLLIAALRSDAFLLCSNVVENLDNFDLSAKVESKGQVLDLLLIGILRQPVDSLGEENLKKMHGKVFERIRLALSGVVNGDRKLSDVLSTLDVFGVLLQRLSERMKVHVPLEILQHMGAILEMEESRRNPGTFELCSLAMEIVEKSGLKQRLQVKSLLFLRLADLIALRPKQELRIWDPSQSYLALMLLTLQNVESFDLDILKRMKPALISQLVTSCLSYGIGHAEQSPAESSLSLELAVTLLDRFGNPSSHLASLDVLEEHIVSSTFNLISANSKFGEVLSSTSPKVEAVKLQLVKLMSSCVRFSSQGINLGAEVWTSLFTAFNAGLSELDVELRILFDLCLDLPHEAETIYVPYTDEFRWKSCVEEVGKSDKISCDWLVEALDPTRLRATVSHFPIFDSIETGSEPAEKSVQGMNNEATSSDDEMSVADSVSTKSVATTTTDSRNGDEWTRDCSDLRYSPAFLLPLILGVLEDNIPSRETRETETEVADDSLSNSLNGTENSQFKGLVQLTQKLCDAGVHGLCLAALASKCNKVRQCSFAILNVILLVCGSEEARNLSSWRSRPQVWMLLNSVQRAFVIKKATNKLNGVDLAVPPLSPLVSTFLARASSVVIKPEDSLFVPLNRFFLKTERDHGAFQDMNRLPGFISLFCSVAEDPSQSRQERMWALQLIRDAFRDASCYRLIAECHAPDLILTSFENLRHSQLSEAMKDSEYALIFTVFRQMFSLGSNRVMNHLVSRVGVLSWIRTWCTTWPLQESFPRVNSRISFCELVGCIAEQACICEPPRTDSFLYELCSLAEPVILLGLDTKKTDEGFADLIETICRTLDSIKRCVLKHKGAYSFSDIHPLGLSIETTSDFWKLLDGDALNSAVVALSTVPLRLDQPDEEGARAMVSMLLRSCMQSAGSASDDQVVLMNRVLLLISQLQTCTLANAQMTRDLLIVRPTFVTSKQRLDIFNSCLRGIISAEYERSWKEYKIASKLLESSTR